MMHEYKLRGAAQTPIADRLIQKCRNLSPELQRRSLRRALPASGGASRSAGADW